MISKRTTGLSLARRWKWGLVAILLLGSICAARGVTAAVSGVSGTERYGEVIRILPRPAPTMVVPSDTGLPQPSPVADSVYQRVVDTSVMPFSTVGYLDIVLLNGVGRRCTGIAVAAKVVMTSASCLKPGRDVDGALAAQIQFTPGLTQASAGAAPTAPSGTRSYRYYEMTTSFYDGLESGPDYAAVFFNDAVTSSSTFLDVGFGRVPPSVQIVGYASAAAGESGSVAQWQAGATLTGLTERRLLFPFPYDQGLSGTPIIEAGSDGISRIVGFAVAADGAGLSATRLLATDTSLIQRWLGLTPVNTSIQNGWWWSPNEPGRGYFIEITDGRLFMAMLGYGSDHLPSWRVASGIMATSRSFRGDFVGFADGAPIGAAYRLPAASDTLGPVTLDFHDDQSARLTTPLGTTELERYPITANGLLYGASEPPYPETGFWWNPAEPGTGVVVEVQGSTTMISLLDYGMNGRPRWSIAVNSMIIPVLFVGVLQSVTSGPPDGEVWSPVQSMTSDKQAILEVKAPDLMVLAFSTGERIPLSRFKF